MPRIYTRIPVADRFWDKVDKKGEDECWIWTATKTNGGYGKIKHDGIMECAHRIAWEITNGPIPKGKYILHKCDNPSCVNPKHLFLGTQKENIQDAMRKGRIPKGSKQYKSKLTEKIVLEIRSSELTDQELAVIYSVNKATINDARIKRTWKHV